jgi:hypothetical protein
MNVDAFPDPPVQSMVMSAVVWVMAMAWTSCVDEGWPYKGSPMHWR